MKHSLFILIIILSSNFFYPQQKKILVVTGGKNFEAESFYSMFDRMTAIEYDTISKPAAFLLFGSEEIKKYNAIIFYDAYQPISENEKKSFLNIFESGIGTIFLHHSLVSHQDWDEYEKVVGGKYHHKPYIDDGKKFGASTYKHDQVFIVKIIDENNPVTIGLQGFQIQDEIYINYKTHDYVTPVLTSDNCESGKYIGWTNVYKNSKIVFLQPGHDHYAFENSNFRRLIFNSINWVSEK